MKNLLTSNDKLNGLEKARLARNKAKNKEFVAESDPLEQEAARANLGWRAWLPSFCCSGGAKY